MNETIKTKAQELYPVESKAECHVAFIQGAELNNNMGWKKIQKNENGYITEEQEEAMAKNVPFMVFNDKWHYYKCAYDESSLDDVLRTISWNSQEYSQWYVVPKVENVGLYGIL